MPNPEFCPNCHIGLSNNERFLAFCQNCRTDFDDYDDDADIEEEFDCCANCDLPDACSDFGCAIKQGLRDEDDFI